REKGQGRKDRSSEGTADRQGHQSHGRFAALRAGGNKDRDATRYCEERPQEDRGAKGDAAADPGQKNRPGGNREGSPGPRQTQEGGLKRGPLPKLSAPLFLGTARRPPPTPP